MQNTNSEPKTENNREQAIFSEQDVEIIDKNDEKENEVFGENLKSLSDFAKECGKAYETIRKKVAEAQDILGAHIIYNPKTRTRYIDSFAQDYLRSNSAIDYIQLAESSAVDEVKALRAKYDELTAKYIALTDENKELWKKFAETSRIEAESRFQIEKNEELAEKTKELEKKVAELQAENDTYEPYQTLFGTRYKKVEKK